MKDKSCALLLKYVEIARTTKFSSMPFINQNDPDIAGKPSVEGWFNQILIPAIRAYRQSVNYNTANHLQNELHNLHLTISYLKSKFGDIFDTPKSQAVAACIYLTLADIALELILDLDTKLKPLSPNDQTIGSEIGIKIGNMIVIVKSSLTEVEKIYDTAAEAVEELREYKTSLCKGIQDYLHQYETPLSIDELRSHILRKNMRSAQLGGAFNGKIVYNAKSNRVVKIDANIIRILVSDLKNIAEGKSKRTQYIVYMHGNQTHSAVLDADFNQNTKLLELIAIDSTQQLSFWEFLEQLTEALRKIHLNHQVLASLSNLQRDLSSCNVYSLALGAISSKWTFQQLDKNAKIPQPEFISPLRKKESKVVLNGVKWLPIHAFGEKPIKMAQSIEYMRQLLTEIYPNNPTAVEDKISGWKRQYYMSPESSIYYINHRSYALDLQHVGEPYRGLSVAGLLKKYPTMTIGLAVLRIAQKQEGPLREFKFLVERAPLSALNTTSEGTKRTPLHWALHHGSINRADILLKRGARADLPDADGVTAQSLIMKMPQYQALKQYFPSASEIKAQIDDVTLVALLDKIETEEAKNHLVPMCNAAKHFQHLDIESRIQLIINGYTDNPAFTKLDNANMTYLLNPYQSASQALDGLDGNHLMIIDCAIAIEIIRFRAILERMKQFHGEVAGKQRFDDLFGSAEHETPLKYRMKFVHSYISNYPDPVIKGAPEENAAKLFSPIRAFLKTNTYTSSELMFSELRGGATVGITGDTKGYLAKHPFGMSASYNCIVRESTSGLLLRTYLHPSNHTPNELMAFHQSSFDEPKSEEEIYYGQSSNMPIPDKLDVSKAKIGLYSISFDVVQLEFLFRCDLGTIRSFIDREYDACVVNQRTFVYGSCNEQATVFCQRHLDQLIPPSNNTNVDQLASMIANVKIAPKSYTPHQAGSGSSSAANTTAASVSVQKGDQKGKGKSNKGKEKKDDGMGWIKNPRGLLL